MSDNTGYPNSGDTTRTELEKSYNELKKLHEFSSGRGSPAFIMEKLIEYEVETELASRVSSPENWDPDNDKSPVSLTDAAIKSVEDHRRKFLSIVESTTAVVSRFHLGRDNYEVGVHPALPAMHQGRQVRFPREYPAEAIRKLQARYDQHIHNTVRDLESVLAKHQLNRQTHWITGIRTADAPIRDAYNSFQSAVMALYHIAITIEGLINLIKSPGWKENPSIEDADEPKGDEDADEPKGDEDADEPKGDEDADEPEGDEDADEPEGDEDEPEGDEDAEFSKDFKKKNNQRKYPCQGQRHDGQREPGGRDPEQSPGRRPDKPSQGKRQDRKNGSNQNKKGSNQNKKGSKKNTYYLDPVTNKVYRCDPDTKIPANARVIRQPPSTRMPSPAAFYDFSLLPKGSSLSAPPDPAYVKDDDLRKRVGETAKRLGLGEDARRALFQILDCTANRNTAFAEYIKVANDLGVAAPGSHDAALKAAVAAGNTYTSMLGNLPGSVSARTNIVEALAELKRLFSRDARLIDLTYDDRSGSIMTIECGSYTTMENVCTKLRDNDRLRVPLGAKILHVRPEQRVTNGNKHKYWTITVACSEAPAIEIAAALSGESAKISHQLVEGKVSYQYKVSVNGKVIETPLIPSPPTAASARFLFEQLLAGGEPGLDAMVETFKRDCEDPLSDLAGIAAKKFEASGKTICTLEDARQAFSLVDPSDVLSDEKRRSIAEAPRKVVTSTGKDMGVTYRRDAAYIEGFSFHPADPLVVGLPVEVPVGDEQFPTRIRHVRFEEKKNKGGYRVVLEHKNISEIRADREHYFASRAQDPVAALREELRQHFISEVTRDMASMLLNPEEFQIQNAKEPEEGMKREVRRRHVTPYRSKNGDIIRLVATLTLSSPPSPEAPTWNASWHKWCQDSVNLFNANKNNSPRGDFFAFAPGAAADSENLIAAGMFLVSERLGRAVSREELYEIAKSCGLEGDGTGDHKVKSEDDMWQGVDQGRALARALAAESGKTLPKPARNQKRPSPGNQAEVRGKSEVVEAAREADLTAALTNSGSGEGQTKEKVSENVRPMTPDESAAHEAGHDAASTPLTNSGSGEENRPDNTEFVASALKEAAKETTTPVSWAAPDSATGQQTETGPDGVPHPPTPASEPAVVREIYIGRANTNSWVIPDKLMYKTASNNHALIRIYTDYATIEDLGSTNGTFIDGDGVKIEKNKEYKLREGALLRFGDIYCALFEKNTLQEIAIDDPLRSITEVFGSVHMLHDLTDESAAPEAGHDASANLSRPTVEGSGNYAYAEKALLLKLDDRTKSALQAIPIPDHNKVLTEYYATPVNIKRLDPDHLHVTLISYANFVNETDDRDIIANHNFPAPSIELGECRYVHRTDAYDKDGNKILKVTYVVSLKNQGEMQEFVNKLYAQAGRPNPEPNRFFHVTLANNWGGNPFLSIGDVTIRDFQQS